MATTKPTKAVAKATAAPEVKKETVKATAKVEPKVEAKKETAASVVKAEPKKETVKKEAAKKAEPKKEATKKAEPKKETAKKTTAKKATTKKTATKKTEKIVVQFFGKELDVEAVKEAAKADYVAKGGKKTITSVEIYVKPEDNKAYYVIDGSQGSISL